MTIRTLSEAFRLAAQSPDVLRPDASVTENGPQPSASTEAPVFVDFATVATVFDSSVTVLFNGVTESTRAATDEPLRAGQLVRVSRGTDGVLVIHGSDH